jgi:hypothetical protein
MTERISIPNTRTIAELTFHDTGHVTDLPREYRLGIPEIGNSKVTIGLSSTALRNIELFTKRALALEPGQNVQADMNELSRFRNAYFTPLPGEAVKFIPFGQYGDRTLVQTNIDPYEKVVEELGVEGAPRYEELFAREDWIESGLDYVSPAYAVAKGGLKAMLYMRGDLPDSEIDFTPEYSLGIIVFSSSDKDIG